MNECLDQPLTAEVNFQQYSMYAALFEKICLIGYNNSDIYLFVTVKQASPLPQAAHIGVSWVQRVAQTNQEAQKQQDGGAM